MTRYALMSYNYQVQCVWFEVLLWNILAHYRFCVWPRTDVFSFLQIMKKFHHTGICGICNRTDMRVDVIIGCEYCRMANFSVSFIFPFFPKASQTGINNTGKKQYSACPDLINTEKSLFFSINIYSLVY